MLDALKQHWPEYYGRDKVGVAELPEHNADIIYVLDGSATFVTGGTVIDPKPTLPGEIRGKEITGGDRRQIAKGNVIIVPTGMPHWFKVVPGPLNY